MSALLEGAGREALPPRGASSLAERGEPVFASPFFLLGFVFIIGAVLAVVFPSGREYAEVTNKRVDAYSIAYLTVLIRANPKDAQLRIVYVKQLAELGRWDEALEVLAAAPTPPDDAAAEMRGLKLDLTLARARSIPEGDPRRAEAFDDVRAELASLLGQVPTSRLGELATLAVELDDPALATKYFVRLAEVDAERRSYALAQAGRWSRAAGDDVLSAECYRRAAEAEKDPIAHANLLMSGADALEGSTGACAAAGLVEEPAQGSTYVPLIARATALMTACGRAVNAKLLGRRILQLEPGKRSHVTAQIRRELAAGDPAGALALLRGLLAKQPGDPVLREATARVAEWAGQPQVALEQWLWLLNHGRAPSATLKLPD